jgi:ketosteroid isomerase-like protein
MGGKEASLSVKELSVADFPEMLKKFAAAVEANDGAGLAALFTDDGVYEDGFYGAYTGAAAIAGMVAHFHETGQDFRWEFVDPVSDGRTGYAHYRFSYRSKVAGAEGKPVAFEGISHVTLRDGKIARYCEVFDRGLALAQQGFAAERIKRVVEKAAARQNTTPEFAAHLRRLAERPA